MKVLASLVTALLFLGVSQAMNCYTCDSSISGQAHCKDPFKKPAQNEDHSCLDSFNQVFSSYKNEFPQQFSNQQQDSCVKVVYKDPNTDEKQRVVRGCASGLDNVCQFLTGNLPGVYCFGCKGNLCNGATSLSAASAAFVALFSTIMVIKM